MPPNPLAKARSIAAREMPLYGMYIQNPRNFKVAPAPPPVRNPAYAPDYIAHTDPIFKKLHMVKVTDMFCIASWKFYYKLRNNLLPPYFNYMKSNLPVICNHCNVRNPEFHFPLIKHEFAKTIAAILFNKALK